LTIKTPITKPIPAAIYVFLFYEDDFSLYFTPKFILGSLDLDPSLGLVVLGLNTWLDLAVLSSCIVLNLLVISSFTNNIHKNRNDSYTSSKISPIPTN